MVVNFPVVVPFQENREEKESQWCLSTRLCCCQSSMKAGSNLLRCEIPWRHQVVTISTGFCSCVGQSHQIGSFGFADIFHAHVAVSRLLSHACLLDHGILQRLFQNASHFLLAGALQACGGSRGCCIFENPRLATVPALLPSSLLQLAQHVLPWGKRLYKAQKAKWLQTNARMRRTLCQTSIGIRSVCWCF